MRVLKHAPCLFFLWLALSAAATPATVRVTRVIDGDTVGVSDGRTVRYLGINTPERGHPFAEAATRLNRKLVFGKEVRLVLDREEKDGYGRTLAYVYVGEKMVNASLLAEGLAHAFAIGSLSHYQDFLRIQGEAKAQARGIWGQGGFPGPLKITSLHADAEGDDRTNLNGEYIRICNISDEGVTLRGFSLEDEYVHQTGQSVDSHGTPHRYIFPDFSLEPGYTLLLLTGSGHDLTNGGKDLVLHWRSAHPIWNNDRETAYLLDPEGRVIDTFSYVGKRHSRE